MSDYYGLRDAACPLSTRGGGLGPAHELDLEDVRAHLGVAPEGERDVRALPSEDELAEHGGRAALDLRAVDAHALVVHLRGEGRGVSD